jgi:hypothetical protein
MSDGSILDLVSRGKKDAFFIQNPALTWFTDSYKRRSPSVREIRVEQSFTEARFGHWIDIALPTTGDILTAVDIRIQMPTWLPPSIVALNTHRNTVGVKSDIVDSSGNNLYVQYGWTNGIANFLISRWAFYIDNIMVQEGFGDYNDWYPDSLATHMTAPILHASTGTHNGSAQNIQLNASPPELIFRVPMVGCQKQNDTGFPLAALRGKNMYLRMWFREKKQLVESAIVGYSDASNLYYDASRVVPPGSVALYEICPTPWGGKRIRVNGVDVSDVTVPEYDMQLLLYGRYTILHLEPELKQKIASIPYSILFTQQRVQNFTIEDSEWPRTTAGVTQIKREIEIKGTYQRLLLGLSYKASLQQNRYRNLSPVGFYEWFTSVSLVINAYERIIPLNPKKLKNLSQNAQLERDVNRDLYFLVFGVSPDDNPAGVCNITRTQKCSLVLGLSSILPDPQLQTRQSFGTIVGESWNLLDIQDGRVQVRFND